MPQTYEPLKSGDKIAVVSPTGGGDIISDESKELATERFKKMGLQPVYYETTFQSVEMSVDDKKARAKDINDAFLDPQISGIITILGGYSSVHILEFLDFENIKNNPKLFCGYSDVTALNTALFTKSGLVTVSGPHFSSFGMKHGFEYTLKNFKRLAFREEGTFQYTSSSKWSNDLWFLNQNDREFIPNDGPLIY